MYSSIALTAVLSTILCTLAHAQCSGPVEPAVVGKTIRSIRDCNGPDGFQFQAFLSITRSGVSWKPLYFFDKGDSTVCPEEIVSVFRRKYGPAVLLWTPAKDAIDFKDSHPQIYKQFVGGNRNVKFPCNKFTQRIGVRGSTRSQFVKLVSKMVSGIVHSRRLRCDSPPLKGAAVLERQDVHSNALSYLYNLAYANFFCVRVSPVRPQA